MLKLTFKQTSAEVIVRAASTIIFNTLNQLHYPSVALSELAENPQYGFTDSASIEEVGAKFVRITDLKDGGINWDTVPYCKCDEPEKYLIYPNDILFARTGATTGKTHLVRKAPYAVFASYLIRIRPKPLVDPEYLYSFFQSDAYWTQILDEKEGSAQPNVNGQKLMKILVPMLDREIQSAISKFLEVVRKRQDGSFEELPKLPPPLEQQRRIIMRVEEMVEKVEEVRSLRQKALKETDILLTRAITTILDNDEWEELPLNKLLRENSLNGLSPRPSETPPGLPILRISAATSQANAIIDEADFKYLEVSEQDAVKYKLEPGDLLACRYNGNLHYTGKFALYKAYSGKEHLYPDKLIRFRVDTNNIMPEFARLALNSAKCRKIIESFCATTAGNIGLSAGNLKTVPVPVPPLLEQHRIVAYFEELQTKVDTMKRLREQAMIELDALLPSILDKAFKGGL
ncbi:restriction endonuclease subunit S [Desmonostoc muscorum CCALA 125]|nr:restriction endonuclease subunit S [Desmonostoc muscorum CCALA 125]